MTAIAAIIGASARRSITQRATAEDPYADEDFNRLEDDRSLVVTTPDGVPLAASEAGPADAPLTLVFVHGFCLQRGAFHFQRTRLPDQLGSDVRMVFYDQRGHGRSGETAPETYTLTQLGKDLQTVLDVVAPRGL
ncbi:alpha/beta fold hydrolase, partial [Mycobacterium sp.]|uniref:alpha/beta fold hydrolase n=1 Tax=Mycobacterium sp. TaxID=1785 RepID=UPI00345C19E7